MNIRTALNRNPMIAVVAVVVVVLVAAWSIHRSIPSGPVIRTSAYFSADDGQTWFEADAKQVAPIMHEGKPAVRAHLFTCPDGKQFVGYLERFSDEAKAVLEEVRAAMAAKGPDAAKPKVNIGAVQSAAANGRQVKKPGDKQWTNSNSPAGTTIRKVTCPDGQAATSAE